MSFIAWIGFIGALLLLMALSSAYLKNLPITTSVIYLIIGLIIGPIGLNIISINFVEWRVFFEHLTEIAVIISLFIGGLKLRLPLRDKSWTAAFRLAGPVMLVSIIGVACFAHFVFDFAWPLSFLLGAILAPTDPVLASTVSVNDAADHDRMRYGLSGEAGFNDGAAFPFVVFALMWAQHDNLGSWVGEWALHRLVWAIPVALLFGYFLAKSVARVAIYLRTRHQDNDAPNDFLALSLIALSYVGAETIGAWGFLSAFAAGLGFRQAEMKTIKDNPLSSADQSKSSNHYSQPNRDLPAEHITNKKPSGDELNHPSKAAGMMVSEIISFADTAERFLEVMVVMLVGASLTMYWDWRAIPLACALFFVIRPIATLIFLMKTPTNRMQRLMMGWFGIRGIGSLYYLSYALNNGLNDRVTDAVGITLSVIALSILVHGFSSQPILSFYERRIAAKKL
ncbi:MAG: sodium:proton antiporter [Pseudomonadota bacterium]